MRSAIGFLFLFVAIKAIAQPVDHVAIDKGIKWVTGLSWEQVKAKAKAENKYIFLDCFTTWCGPCKEMDNCVFSDDSVGNYFNDKFISVRVQIDKTKKDDSHVQKWYSDAAIISKQYQIEAFPTFLYFSPNGTLTYRHEGATVEVSRFIKNSSGALVAGNVFVDPDEISKEILTEFKKGNQVVKDSLRRIVSYARRIKDPAYYLVLEEYINYLASVGKVKRYTKKNIQLWEFIPFDSRSILFNFFLEGEQMIDKVMQQKYYAAERIDRVIQKEVCIPFFIEQNKVIGLLMNGYYQGDPNFSSTNNADWNKLTKLIKKQFGKKYVDRAVLTAQVEWYTRNRNFPAFIKYGFLKADKYYPDEAFTAGEAGKVNDLGFYTFLHLTDKESLNRAIAWVERAVKRLPAAFIMDTYACLLYKAGRIGEAIQWEEKAVNRAPKDQELKHTLERMKRGKKWEGVAWE